MLSFDGIIVILVILFIIASLYFNLIGPAFTFIIGVLLLGILGVLTPHEILSGLANEHIMVIILLLMLAQMIKNTGVLDGILNPLLMKSESPRNFLLRLYLLVAFISMFINNTPLVALMIPFVVSWCKDHGRSSSKFLIPLSFAAILGGVSTLIGTSTNLIVNGLIQAQQVIPSFKPFEIYHFSYVGIPLVLAGFIYIYFFSDRLLPDRTGAYGDFVKNTRSYLVPTRIKRNSSLAGLSVKSASLHTLKGLYLAEIIRGNEAIQPVSPHEILRPDDILVFAGETNTITELVNSNTGLELTELGMFRHKPHIEAIEVVVSYNSGLSGQTVQESMFRSRYDAAVIAVHRNGERLSGRIGDIRLKPGDVLLLIAGSNFNKLSQDTQDFYLISKVRDIRKIRFWEPYMLIGGLVIAIILSVMKIVPLFTSLAILTTFALLFNLINPRELIRTVDFNLAIILAMSLALGHAMIKTGVASQLATGFIDVFLPLGSFVLLSGIFIIAVLLTNLITNAAVVAVLFPIVLSVAAKLAIDPFPLVMVMTVGASMSFILPVGYQTNLMVLGPGGYQFRDFLRIGLPLTIISMAIVVPIMYLMFFFEFSGLRQLYLNLQSVIP